MQKREYNSNDIFAKKVEFLDNPERRGDIPPKQLPPADLEWE
ncbi:hypothetical protein GCM10011409_35460 [Lentibacillus populi]|uniref:Uncharacterized protein n=1 Tax=Lentibacillus populi TaxID=1827502 RepID=A0A9W5U0C2_9BACI|nr:hypothetical protein [Lentibacillus populi]GGB54763.1 hypothetical protein GCM10011409_35460 [Lentibacillus populi]